MINEFRIRQTDDPSGYWVVADGNAWSNTRHYIDRNGFASAVCVTYCTLIDARTAFALYLAKQGKEDRENENPMSQEIARLAAECTTRDDRIRKLKRALQLELSLAIELLDMIYGE